MPYKKYREILCRYFTRKQGKNVNGSEVNLENWKEKSNHKTTLEDNTVKIKN